MDKYSHDAQDEFVLELFGNGKFYVDIGCGDGISMSNSLRLEENGWNGILIDYDNNTLSNCHRIRTSKNIYLIDATNKELLIDSFEKSNCPTLFEYLSLDIDDPSLACLQIFPFEKYRFKFLTFEHDLYCGRPINHDRKNITQEILIKQGYTKLVDNVLAGGTVPYEDWYITNECVDIINLFKNISGITGEDCVKILKEYKSKINL